jgi:hypothetical protein
MADGRPSWTKRTRGRVALLAGRQAAVLAGAVGAAAAAGAVGAAKRAMLARRPARLFPRWGQGNKVP